MEPSPSDMPQCADSSAPQTRSSLALTEVVSLMGLCWRVVCDGDGGGSPSMPWALLRDEAGTPCLISTSSWRTDGRLRCTASSHTTESEGACRPWVGRDAFVRPSEDVHRGTNSELPHRLCHRHACGAAREAQGSRGGKPWARIRASRRTGPCPLPSSAHSARRVTEALAAGVPCPASLSCGGPAAPADLAAAGPRSFRASGREGQESSQAPRSSRVLSLERPPARWRLGRRVSPRNCPPLQTSSVRQCSSAPMPPPCSVLERGDGGTAPAGTAASSAPAARAAGRHGLRPAVSAASRGAEAAGGAAATAHGAAHIVEGVGGLAE
mmetsp:Transcript_100793/g.310756  ORF Transcript_100793/g.310756 Transcript_100793/m.310756 type:complete len:325 (+) Transcript_100793:1111-2085(+)